jgi:PAS domain S-box-containing protein
MATGTKSSSFSNLVASWTKRFFVRSRSLPIAVGVALLTTTLILWQALLAQERADIEQAIQLEASNANFQITRQLQERTQALERMAKRWEYSGKPPKDYWEADAKLYVENFSGFQAIEWVDPSFYVGWIVPIKGNEAVQNLYLGFEPRRKMALEAARNQRQTVVTRTINLRQGGKGFLVYVPIFQQEDFGGFIVGVFRTTEFLDTIFNDLDKRTGRKYALRIFDGNEQIYSHYLGNGANENKWGQDKIITFNGVTWRMRVWPEQQFLAEQRSPLPTVVLIAGLLMAVLFPLAIDLAQIARQRAKKVEMVNQELEAEIIQRKLAEESLKKHEEEREQQRQWLEITLSSIGDAVIATDTAAVITFMNPMAEALTGWTVQDALGRKIDEVFCIIDEYTRQPTEIPVERVLREGVVVKLADNTVLITPDAREIPIDDSCAPIRNESGTLQGAVLIFRDITKRKLAEWEIRNALAKEKELNELKSRFISMTSHEFRTPLTTILGSSELLEYYSDKLTEEKKLNHLHRIQTTVKHLAHLLDDVLLIGKADAGRVDVNPEPINLEQFCHTLVEELQLSASTQHTLIFVSQGQCTDACMDEKLLRHIFSNLLSNAIKYSPAGGTIHFALACQDREAIFQIRDEGIGIPPEDLKQLFESFHRATNVANIAGTGLGLAIVKKSVDLQGGKIEVNSQIALGTTFTVTLPLNKEN